MLAQWEAIVYVLFSFSSHILMSSLCPKSFAIQHKESVVNLTLSYKCSECWHESHARSIPLCDILYWRAKYFLYCFSTPFTHILWLQCLSVFLFTFEWEVYLAFSIWAVCFKTAYNVVKIHVNWQNFYILYILQNISDWPPIISNHASLLTIQNCRWHGITFIDICVHDSYACLLLEKCLPEINMFINNLLLFLCDRNSWK